MTEETDLPFATHSGEVTIGGVVLHVHRLSDGSNVIECQDLEAFFAAMGAGVDITEEDAMKLAKVVHGHDHV